MVDSRMVRTDDVERAAWLLPLGGRQFVVGAPHDEPTSVGEHDLLPERLTPVLLGRAAGHDEGLDRREVHQRAELIEREFGVTEIDPSRLVDGRVGRPVLRDARSDPIRTRPGPAPRPRPHGSAGSPASPGRAHR